MNDKYIKTKFNSKSIFIQKSVTRNFYLTLHTKAQSRRRRTDGMLPILFLKHYSHFLRWWCFCRIHFFLSYSIFISHDINQNQFFNSEFYFTFLPTHDLCMDCSIFDKFFTDFLVYVHEKLNTESEWTNKCLPKTNTKIDS